VTTYRAHVNETGELWEVEYEAVSDAVHFACRDLREGRRTPIEIAEDGVRVHDLESLTKLCTELDAEREGEGDAT
jgi:hypothetical protein